MWLSPHIWHHLPPSYSQSHPPALVSWRRLWPELILLQKPIRKWKLDTKPGSRNQWESWSALKCRERIHYPFIWLGDIQSAGLFSTCLVFITLLLFIEAMLLNAKYFFLQKQQGGGRGRNCSGPQCIDRSLFAEEIHVQQVHCTKYNELYRARTTLSYFDDWAASGGIAYQHIHTACWRCQCQYSKQIKGHALYCISTGTGRNLEVTQAGRRYRPAQHLNASTTERCRDYRYIFVNNSNRHGK